MEMEIDTARLRSLRIIQRSDGRYLRIGYRVEEETEKQGTAVEAEGRTTAGKDRLRSGKRVMCVMGRNIGKALVGTARLAPRAAWSNRVSRIILLSAAAGIIVTLLAHAIY